MSDASSFREQAKRCREQATQFDETTGARLRAMADDYDRRAEAAAPTLIDPETDHAG